MAKKHRKNHTAQEKVQILRRHLLDQVAVSDLCDQYHFHPIVFYRWGEHFFENGAFGASSARVKLFPKLWALFARQKRFAEWAQSL